MSGPSHSPDPAGLVGVGIIRKSHGVRGEASVEPLTPDLDRFEELSRVYLVSPDQKDILEVEIVTVRVHTGRVLILFSSIDSPERVAELRGWTVEIPQDEIRLLEEHEVFLHDLPGMVVEERDGRRVGEVVGVVEGGGGLLLSVQKPDGRKFDLPFAASICTEVDVFARRIVVNLPAGLENLSEADEVAQPPLNREQSSTGDDRGVRAPSPARISEENLVREPGSAVLRIDVVTIFPAMFAPFLEEGVLARAVKRGLLDVRIWDLRDFAKDKHRSTDDEAYGGGAGMVMLAEPVFACVEKLRDEGNDPYIMMTSPQGTRFDQDKARELAGRRHLVILCGRYEGFDERIRTGLVDEEVSVGDFVVSGGEVPAMLVIDAVTRMVEGVVGKQDSVVADSFYDGLLDYPHYTRPASFRGIDVPAVLISGHAEKIRKWRKLEALRATLTKRPDLLERAELDEEARTMLAKLAEEIKERSSL